MKSLLPFLFILIFVRISSAQITFTAPSFYTGGAAASAIVSADFNGDGVKDLATPDLISNSVSVLLGDGTGGFLIANFYPAGYHPGTICTGDFNEDGFMDLVVTNYSSSISVLLGNGTGSFGTPMNYATLANPGTLISADFNNDGHMDIATAGDATGVSVLIGDGSGNLAAAVNTTVANCDGMMTENDFNNDGTLDLAVLTELNGYRRFSVFAGNGAGGFSDLGFYIPNGSNGSLFAANITSGDYNNDGFKDVAVSGYAGYNKISVFKMMVGGGFEAAVHYALIVPNGAAATLNAIKSVDFNSDTHLDLCVSYGCSGGLSPGGIWVLEGNASGVFSNFNDLALATSTAVNPKGLACADFNGDGTMDCVIGSSSGSNGACKLTAWLNQTNLCVSSSMIKDSLCPGHSYNFGGVNYVNPGIYSHVIPNANVNGCDSTIVLHLNHNYYGYGCGTYITMSLENVIQTSCNEFEFDVYITNTSTLPLDLQGYSFGVNHAAGMSNGGVISVDYLSSDPVFSSLVPSISTDYTSATKHIQFTTLLAYGSLVVPLPNGLPLRIATMRVSTTTSWPANFQPDLTLQNSYAIGKTQCVAACAFPMMNVIGYTIFGSSSAPFPLGLEALTSINPLSPIVLNPACVNTSHAVSVCSAYTWPVNGVTYTTSGVYTYTTMNTMSCPPCVSTDSLILTIQNSHIMITESEANLIANVPFASFQWMDCAKGIPLDGEINQTLASPLNGDYQVIITDNTCTDTSDCYTVRNVGVGVNEFVSPFLVNVFPNPSSGIFNLSSGASLKKASVKVLNLMGEIVLQQNDLYGEKVVLDLSTHPDGIYVLELTMEGRSERMKVTKE